MNELDDGLAEGKATLPLLYSLWNSEPEQAAAIREAIEKGGREHLEIITAAIESTGACALNNARLGRRRLPPIWTRSIK